MPSWRFWDKRSREDATLAVGELPRTATHGGLPPEPRPPRLAAPLTDEARQRRLAQLDRRREAMLFDVAQGELALSPDNPWQERIDLLTEALATVDQDRAPLQRLPTAPTFPLPAIPIIDIQVDPGEPATVSFTIGAETFLFGEEIDWDERGGAVVRGQFRQREGDAGTLLPIDVPDDRREALTRHLSDSIDVFAIDLRDRALASESLPEAPTLADLARPCPECGGWRDWHGRCAVCTERAWQRQQLDAEATRLERERAKEAEERQRWVERLPFARRRLLDVEAERAMLGG